ncbi:SDR family NAD(P)-dependent oxidoreductase [Steroidobacter flavus]|uniref:SDR family NAD(P)-dependent oxidoreductase n=1 Tax=Steroidobacter flavus TaxID=1842136 RepID=A0ABV8T5Y1_9GAMM
MIGLADKSVIVTGGGSGIGRAAVELLVGHGAIVTVADINEAGGREVVESVNANGARRAQFVRANVADEAEVKAMVEAAEAFGGRLDAAINGAGIGQLGKKVHELDASEWDAHMAINLRGMFLCMKYEIAAMLKVGGGSICAISSVAAVMGLTTSPEYCAGKAGVNGLVRAAAIDYAKQGIRINALLPGATNTPLAVKAAATKPKDVGPMTLPNGRRAEPVEIARGAVWMISDEASYMTGSCLTLDGGLSIV